MLGVWADVGLFVCVRVCVHARARVCVCVCVCVCDDRSVAVPDVCVSGTRVYSTRRRRHTGPRPNFEESDVVTVSVTAGRQCVSRYWAAASYS